MDQYSYFRIFHSLSQADFDLLLGLTKRVQYPKGHVITEVGEVQRDLLFVVEGVQMSYYEHESKLHVIAFTYPPNPCAIPESFNSQTPSRYTLKCLTDSSFQAISHHQLQLLFDRSPGVERLFRKMTEAILGGVINRHMELHAHSMEMRFKTFCQRSGHLLQLVPHKYIASYLDIDPTNFSKLYNSIRI